MIASSSNKSLTPSNALATTRSTVVAYLGLGFITVGRRGERVDWLSSTRQSVHLSEKRQGQDGPYKTVRRVHTPTGVSNLALGVENVKLEEHL